MKKYDVHLHVSLDQLPRQDKMFLSSAENMIPHLAEMGIERGIALSSGEDRAPLMDNRECRQIAEKYPETYSWMCNVDEEDIDSVYSRLTKYKEQGAVGIGEFMINKKIDNEFIQAVFTAAQKLEMPVLFHMSPEEGYSYGIVDEPGLPLLEEALKKYPKLKFIGHSQVFWHEMSGNPGDTLDERIQWGSGKVVPGGRVPYLMENYPNLYCDLSANSGGCAIMRDEEFGLAFLEKYSDRIMFGTDMVNVEMTFPLGGWLDKMVSEGKLSEEAYTKICRTNAERIFDLGK